MDDAFALLVSGGRAAIARVNRPPGSASSGAAALALPSDGGWEATLAAARMHGLAPLIRRELLASLPDRLTPALRAQLVAAQQASALRALAGLRELGEVLGALQSARVSALAYKGPVLALDAYGDATLRDCDDLDIVVAPQDADRAAAALGKIGYAPADHRSWAGARAANEWHAQVALVHEGGRMPIDLHWRFCDRKLPWSLPLGEVLARGSALDVGGVRVTIPAREDQVLLVLLHAARHGWDRLDAVVSVGALLAQGVDADVMLARAASVGGRTAVLAGLEVARYLLDAAVPDAALAAIRADGRIATHARTAVERLRRGDAGATRDARLHLALMDGWRARARYLALATALPTAADVAAVRLPRPLAWLYPFVRVWRLVTRRRTG